MAPAEIITVQLGSQANFVGSHFWNLQDEAVASSWGNLGAAVDQEVLLSWTEDRFGDVRYRPRAVVLDLSGAFGGVTFGDDDVAAAAAAASAGVGSWSGGVEVHSLGPAAKSSFRRQLEAAGHLDTDEREQLLAQTALEAAALSLQEEEQPKFWTDYLQVDLQPSTALTLPGVWLGRSDWDGWGSRLDTATARDAAETVLERVRWWAEQCDRPQGLQVLADDLCGWGSMAHAVLQELRDQYSSQPIIYFSIQQQATQTSAAAGSSSSSSPARRLLSHGLSLAELTQLATLYVPLAAPADAASSSFQAAALLAAGIDTATLALRSSGITTDAGAATGATDMHSLAKLLASPAANLAALALQLPAGCIADAASLQQQATSGSNSSSSSDDRRQAATSAAAGAGDGGFLSMDGSSSSCLLTPTVQLTAGCCMAQSITLRGARTRSPAGAIASTGSAKQALDSLLLQRQRSDGAIPCLHHTCISPFPVALPLSFPTWRAHQPAAGATGSSSSSTVTGGAASASQLHPQLTRPGRGAVPAPSCLSQLAASTGFQQLLRRSAQALQRHAGSPAGKACLESWSVDASDASELQERLQQMAGLYDLAD